MRKIQQQPPCCRIGIIIQSLEFVELFDGPVMKIIYRLYYYYRISKTGWQRNESITLESSDVDKLVFSRGGGGGEGRSKVK